MKNYILNERLMERGSIGQAFAQQGVVGEGNEAHNYSDDEYLMVDFIGEGTELCCPRVALIEVEQAAR